MAELYAAENPESLGLVSPHWKAKDEISKYLSWYGRRKIAKRKHLTNAANIHVKTSTLDNKDQRQRSSMASSAAIVENSGDPSESRQYKLKWLKDIKAFECFGCESAIRIPGEIPEPPPNDIIASNNEYRSFMKMGNCKFTSG